jgi:hypothetical protein
MYPHGHTIWPGEKTAAYACLPPIGFWSTIRMVEVSPDLIF